MQCIHKILTDGRLLHKTVRRIARRRSLGDLKNESEPCQRESHRRQERASVWRMK